MGTQSIWKSGARLADGREIVYFDEAPGLGRDQTFLPPADQCPLDASAPGRPAPYIAAWHQAPVRDEIARRQFAAHLQVLSVRRAAGKLKAEVPRRNGIGHGRVDQRHRS